MESRYVINETSLNAGTIVAGEKSQQRIADMFVAVAENLAQGKTAEAYMPGNEDREVSYTHILKVLYRQLNFFEQSEPQNIGVKNIRKQIIEIFPELIKCEYTAEPLPHDYDYMAEDKQSTAKYYVIYPTDITSNTSGNPQSFELEDIQRAKLQQIIINAEQFVEQYRNIAAGNKLFPGSFNALQYIEENVDFLHKKIRGKKVVSEAKKLSELQEEVVEQLQRVLKAKDINSDYGKRAIQRLSNLLTPLGLNVGLIKNPQYSTEEERNVAHAKSKVMRAAWDGMIQKPAYSSLSNHLKDWMKEIPDATKHYQFSDYNLNNSKVWQICEQMPQFNGRVINAMISEMQKLKFPPEQIDKLTYEDFAYFIVSSNSECVVQDKSGNKYFECYPREKSEFFRNLVKKHRPELRRQLDAYIRPKITEKLQKENRSQRLTAEDLAKEIDLDVKKYVENILQGMKKGYCEDKAFNVHHNFPLDNIEYFEEITGKSFTEINKYVTFVNKIIHDGIIHQTDSNVDFKGNIRDRWEGCKNYRTCWINKEHAVLDETGKIVNATEGYSLLIGVQPGIVAIINDKLFVVDKDNLKTNIKYQQDLLDCANTKKLNERMLKEQTGQDITSLFRLPYVLPEKQGPFFDKVREILGLLQAKVVALRVKNKSVQSDSANQTESITPDVHTSARVVDMHQKSGHFEERKVASR